MNKAERKRFNKQLKEKELKQFLDADTKNLDSNDLILAEVMKKFAQDELGIKSEPLTKEIIKNTEDSELTELIWDRINNHSSCLYKKNPRHFKSPEKIIYSLSSELLFIYCYHDYLSQHNLGGVVSFVFESNSTERKALLDGLKELGYHDFVEVLQTKEEEEIYQYFESIKEKVDVDVIQYIRADSERFEIE